MIAVSWLLQHVADVPSSDEWLSASERETLARLWAPKRIRDWRLGRWTAKRALARMGDAGVSESDRFGWARISIRATESGAPYAVIDEREAAWMISLSHSGEHGLCAVASRPAVVGCDVETVVRRGEEFVVDWFTEAERAWIERCASGERSRLVALVWSAKESALKALGVGLRLDTREVQVELTGARCPTWSSLVVCGPDGPLHGWWRADDDRVVTVVATPEPALPVELLA